MGVYLVGLWLGLHVMNVIYRGLAESEPSISPEDLVLRILGFLVEPFELAVVALCGSFCWAIHRLQRHVSGAPLRRRMLTALLAVLFGAASFPILTGILRGLFDVPLGPITLTGWAVSAIGLLAQFGTWVGVVLAVTENSERQARERRLAQVQAQAREAQQRALRYQVNPHLLYNTLNSIAALVLDGRNELAEAMILRLSSFYRSSLAGDPISDVPLAEEVSLLRLYLDIERLRYPALSVDIEIDEDCAELPVPSMILQPLIENVLRHGTNPGDRPTKLRIAAKRRDHELELEIQDNGPGKSASTGSGIGLSNVTSRLHSRFGDMARVETVGRPGDGFVARLSLPVAA